jgi:hypothetical protein
MSAQAGPILRADLDDSGRHGGFPWRYSSRRTTVELPNDVVDELRKRLKRAGGQVQAAERMTAVGRAGPNIVT